jgi:hypothetical protein
MHWTDPITGKEEIGSTTARNYRNNLKNYFDENEGAEDYYNQQQAPIIARQKAYAERDAESARIHSQIPAALTNRFGGDPNIIHPQTPQERAQQKQRGGEFMTKEDAAGFDNAQLLARNNLKNYLYEQVNDGAEDDYYFNIDTTGEMIGPPVYPVSPNAERPADLRGQDQRSLGHQLSPQEIARQQEAALIGHRRSPQEIARQQEAKAAYQASPAFAAAQAMMSQPLKYERRGSPLQQIGAGSSPFGSGNMRQAVMGQPSPRQAQSQGIVPMLAGPREYSLRHNWQ